MKKLSIILFMLIFLAQGVLIYAEELGKTTFNLGEVLVTAEEEIGEGKSKIEGKTLKKIVDLAEILSDEMIEASMIRKSGYGNEVELRGFTKSNLRFTQDDTLIEGSCGSHKDPPLSHINLLTIQKIEIGEGPYDVSVPGALGGNINVITKDTQKGLHGELLSKFDSFEYLSQGGFVTGGSDTLQGLFGYNYSKSGQANDIMTPRVGIDTEKEKTYLNKVEYTIAGLSSISEQLKLAAYYTGSSIILMANIEQELLITKG